MSDALRTGTIRARKPLPIRRKFQILPLGTFSNEILMYFRTQREIAAACGISRSYVSRLEKKALEKLREAMEQKE